MFQIGEFSIITKLSVKTLRYYHEEGLLIPDYVDDESGYRYYRESAVDRAIALTTLRELEFSISEIKEIFANYSEDIELENFLTEQKKRYLERVEHYGRLSKKIDEMISNARRYEMLNINYEDIVEKDIPDQIFASGRYTGRYEDMGRIFRKVAKETARLIAGPALSLYYDNEYREIDADIEAGFPVTRSISGKDVSCRILEGGRAVTIVHKGPYEVIGKSYEKIFKYVEKNGIKTKLPTRAVYIKGPGMIFRGNPDRYVTEIQVMVE